MLIGWVVTFFMRTIDSQQHGLHEIVIEWRNFPPIVKPIVNLFPRCGCGPRPAARWPAAASFVRSSPRAQAHPRNDSRHCHDLCEYPMVSSEVVTSIQNSPHGRIDHDGPYNVMQLCNGSVGSWYQTDSPPFGGSARYPPDAVPLALLLTVGGAQVTGGVMPGMKAPCRRTRELTGSRGPA